MKGAGPVRPTVRPFFLPLPGGGRPVAVAGGTGLWDVSDTPGPPPQCMCRREPRRPGGTQPLGQRSRERTQVSGREPRRRRTQVSEKETAPRWGAGEEPLSEKPLRVPGGMGEEEEEKEKGAAEAGAPPEPPGAAPGLCVGPVTLNVGGKFYSTTLETLTRFPDSMLGAMFRGPRPARTDRHGHYFIDRDGKAFRHVLNFLRLGRLDLPEGYPELALLRAEADFYQIRPLLAELSRLAAERRGRRAHAVLHADVSCRERRLHFTVRGGPQNYGLSTCSLRLFAANLFCTDGRVAALLRGRLGQDAGGEEEPGAARGEEAEEGRHHVHLEWAPRPPDLPEAEYAKQKVRPLRLAPPDGREIATAAEFLEEVLKMALDQGFRVDAIFPDPEDILNSRSLRFVRH